MDKKKIIYLTAFFFCCILFTVSFTKVFAAETWLWPVAGSNGSDLSRGYDPSIKHYGIDIWYPGIEGHDIRAAKSGTVVQSSNECSHYNQYAKTGDEDYRHYCNGGCGNYVTIDHGDGTKSRYLHMQQGSAIATGTVVKRGDVIGKVGSSGQSSGPHCHFDIFVNGSRINNNPGNIEYDFSSIIGHNPQGWVDGVISNSPGTITVTGWAFDKDVVSAALDIHVFIGGESINPSAEYHLVKADKRRTDVNDYSGGVVGDYHGFEDLLATEKTGTQEVWFYAKDANTADHYVSIGHKTVNITPDTTPPVISNIEVTPGYNGYTISCTVMDNAAVSVVRFPTWTEANGSDDLDQQWWNDSSHSKSIGRYDPATGRVTFWVDKTEHNNETGKYITDIYAYDVQGNTNFDNADYPYTYHVVNNVEGNIPVITEADVIDVDYTGYTISISVTDDTGISAIKCPTWTTDSGGDDIDPQWWNEETSRSLAKYNEATGKWEFRVKRSDFNNATGEYITDIYPLDKYGNTNYGHPELKCRVTYTFEQTPPDIENVEITVDDTGYTITCDVYDESGISEVRFPTWTAKNGDDDLDMRWWDTPSISLGTYDPQTGKATIHINFSDHNNERGFYITDIHAHDNLGNIRNRQTGTIITPEAEQIAEVIYNGHTYELYKNTGNYNWTDSNRFCTALGGYLATVTDAAERTVLSNLVTSNGFMAAWLGGLDSGHEGEWHWVTGEPWECEEFWASGNPDNYISSDYKEVGQNYLRMIQDGSFDDCFNDANNGIFVDCFICEYESEETFSITYHLDGGQNNEDNLDSYVKGSTVSLEDPEKEHYTFKGWFLSADGNDRFQNGITYNKDLELYARWEKTGYEITLYVNHEVDPDTEEEGWIRTVTYGDPFGELPEPEWEGHTFMGWFTGETEGTQVMAESIYTGGTSFYAHWEQNPIHVTFDGNTVYTSGLDDYTRSIFPGQVYGTLPELSVEGYDFLGWYTQRIGGTVVTADTVVTATDDHTLSAHWEAKEYTLFFDINMEGMGDPASRKVRYKEAVGELPSCSADEYDFLGWFDVVDGTRKYTEDTIYSSTSDLTVQAKWEKKEVAHTHAYSSAVTLEPTCTETGILTYTCEGCRDTYTEEIPAKGHTSAEGRDGVREATCIETGYTGNLLCIDCGAVLEKGESIAATGHRNTKVLNYRKETCMEDGYTGDTYCTDCETIVTSGNVIPKKEHEWNQGMVTKVATATEDGVMTYTCSVCGETKEEAIPATGETKPTEPANPTDTPTPEVTGFSDVQDPSHPYYKAIYWAAEEGITKGYSDGTFGINRSCTRGEMMMFLWKYARKPAPKYTSKSPFKDVSKSHVFYKAILWGYQKGITKGYSDGSFGIDRNVSRGEAMMFLWRLKGRPAPQTASKSPFKDVPTTNAFYKAILWGSQNGITKGYTTGTNKGKFGINDNCTRGQIVTFLYRAK